MSRNSLKCWLMSPIRCGTPPNHGVYLSRGLEASFSNRMEARHGLSLGDLLDPQRCHDFLLCLLHPRGLRCPNGHALSQAVVHKRARAPILGYRRRRCGRCFNLFTGTVLR